MITRLMAWLLKISKAHVYREIHLVRRVVYKKNVFPLKRRISPLVPQLFLFALKISILIFSYHLSFVLFLLTLFLLGFYWGVQIGINEEHWEHDKAMCEGQYRRMTMPPCASTYQDTYIPIHGKDEAGNNPHASDPMRIWHWIHKHHPHPQSTVLAAKIEPLILNFFRAAEKGDLDMLIAQYAWHARDNGHIPARIKQCLPEEMNMLKRQLEALGGVKKIIQIHILDPIDARHTVVCDIELEFNNGTKDISPNFCITPDFPRTEAKKKTDDELLMLDWKRLPPVDSEHLNWISQSPQFVGLRQAAQTCDTFFRAVMTKNKAKITESSISIYDIPGVSKELDYLANHGLCIADIQKEIKIHGGLNGIALDGYISMIPWALYNAYPRGEKNYTFKEKDRIKDVSLFRYQFYIEYHDLSTSEYLEYYDISMREYWKKQWITVAHQNSDFLHKKNIYFFFHEGKWKVVTHPTTLLEELGKIKRNFQKRILPYRGKYAIY